MLVSGMVDLDCGFDREGWRVKGGISEGTRTLAVKAGVSFANPDMMVMGECLATRNVFGENAES